MFNHGIASGGNRAYNYLVSETLHKVVNLVRNRDVRISEHGYDELAEDGIPVRDAVVGVNAGEVVEDYPEYHKGPCVLEIP